MGWIRRWLTTTNHKDVGILYLVTSLYFGFLGTALSLLIRVQLTFPGMGVMDPSQYNQAVTVHGLIMVLWFLSPLAFAFANYFVPLQIGAEDMAFPRLNAMSYWLYFLGGMLAAIGFFMPGGAISAGWTAYSPLTSITYSPGVGTTLGAAGLLMLVSSVTMSTVNFITTIVRLRGPGMTWSKMPMFTWFIFLTVVIMLFAFPAIFAGVVMLALDRIVGTTWFSSVQGGAVLWENDFWFFGHPEVYVVLFPALGAIADIIEHFANRPLFARKGLMISGFVAVVLSLIVYGHHMYTTPIILPEKEYFTVVTESISLPFGFFIFALIGTLYKARIKMTTPMLFALGAPVMFILGGITGVFNSSVALDEWLRGTYWITGHFHLVMVGSTLFGLFAALYYWWPKLTGRMYNERLGQLHFLTTFVGFIIFSGAMHLLIDMPRRVYTYAVSTGWGSINDIVTVGALLAMLAQLFFLANVFSVFRPGPAAPANPWGAATWEWSPPSFVLARLRAEEGAPPSGGSIERLSLEGPATQGPFSEGISGGSMAYSPAAPLESSKGHDEGHRHSRHFSSRPVTFSLGLLVVFLGVGLGIPILIVGLLIVAHSLVGWARDDLNGRFGGPQPPEGEAWPFGGMSNVKFGTWIFIAADVVFFSIIFTSFVFVRVTSADWPWPGSIHNIPLGTINTVIMLTSGLTTALALSAIKKGNQRGLVFGIAATIVLAFTFLSIKANEWSELFSKGFTFSSGMPGASFYTITGAHAVHVGAGILFLIFLLGKALRGDLTKENHHAVEIFALYWVLVDVIWLFVFPSFYLT